MKKIPLVLFAVVGSASMLAANAALAKVELAPFTDYLTISTTNFPTYGATVSYHGDNSISISGTSDIQSGSDSNRISIHSDNYQSGKPSMTLMFPVTGDTCKFVYYDGGWVNSLNFASGEPPACSHLQVSSITKDDTRSKVNDSTTYYHMNITYTQ